MTAKKIVFLASGTRGDVQPYVALVSALKREGVNAIVATHAAFQPLVERAGVSFRQIEPNPTELLTLPRHADALRFNGDIVESIRATRRYMRETRSSVAQLIRSAWQTSRDADLVIGGLPTLFAGAIAEALRIPVVWAFLQPLTRTQQFPSALLPFAKSLGAAGNLLSHRIVEQAIGLSWQSELNRWRRETLGLSNAKTNSLAEIHSRDDLALYGFSRHVVPRPSDWKSNIVIVGYWFDQTLRPLSSEIEAFLSERDDVVYIGFGAGSLNKPNESLRLFDEALRETNLRGIVMTSNALHDARSSERMLFVDDVSHAALFPRVRAVVHHGGAGTTAACLRAGVPSVILPAHTDQFFWGGRLRALGVSPKPVPQRALSLERLSRSLRVVASDERYRVNAEMLKERICAEDGIRRAVDCIRTALYSSDRTRRFDL
jgi:UDP:flavonoid glycosyltransferase YjiC (YdhE family)